MVKLPEAPGELTVTASDLVVLEGGALLWRIHPTTGRFVLPWDRLRHFGPTTSRFDPHPPPPGDHAAYAVSYAARDPYTPFAEVFQRGRTINRVAGDAYLTGWRITRRVRLLDLTGTWPVANGASHAINTGRHDYCRAWARAIHDHPARVDGLLHVSAMTGAVAVTLFTPAADSFPGQPEFSRGLADPVMTPLIAAAAHRFGYRIA